MHLMQKRGTHNWVPRFYLFCAERATLRSKD